MIDGRLNDGQRQRSKCTRGWVTLSRALQDDSKPLRGATSGYMELATHSTDPQGLIDHVLFTEPDDRQLRRSTATN